MGNQDTGSFSSSNLPGAGAPSTYEALLDADLEWAFCEGSAFFVGRGGVQRALRTIAARLNELQIPYAITGGIALFAHGFRRFTQDVDVLVRPEDLKTIHKALVGHGYWLPFHRCKNLRDAPIGVRIDFVFAGRYPGKQQLQPIAFPDPRLVQIIDGITYLRLPTLIDLKLAAGIVEPGLLKGLADAQEVIKMLRLPVEFELALDPYVREKFRELWSYAQHRSPFVDDEDPTARQRFE